MILLIGNNLVKDNIIESKRDIYYLKLDEIFNISNDIDYKKLISDRKKIYKSYYKLPAYSRLVFMDGEFDKTIKDVSLNKDNFDCLELKGIPCSFGVVEGEVLVVNNVDEISDVKDKILVTKMTDPGWVFLLATAKGVISEKGSLLSHTAIISRELKIPSIVGVDNLMRILKSGDIVRMDAASGVINIIKRS
jgi:pyruvate,water dikinase